MTLRGSHLFRRVVSGADKKRMTKAQNRTAAFSLLVMARDEAFAALTPEKLNSNYGIPLDLGAEMIATEKARREARNG